MMFIDFKRIEKSDNTVSIFQKQFKKKMNIISMMLSCSNFFLRQVRISKKLNFFVNREIYMHIILSYGHKG